MWLVTGPMLLLHAQVMLDASEPQADQSGWQHGSLGYDISQVHVWTPHGSLL